ncbi:MAG: tetratricopeptide repeat protein [Aestuariivirga sp.]|uniref:tetratricopeptide repeat protein n=1 Tax=Aestuariivirga sp. TaxID=2650926 RepID=UPI0025BD6592|nr:tetratricopeptide repeat protein [Aestuariivirga sp.]MCA3559518.1 tetratricopeptide repeat protein [Aestuariivirga sp.]
MPRLRWQLFLAGVLCALSASLARAEDVPRGGFAGSASCAGCHVAEAGAWAGSDHAWALKTPDAASVLGDFNDASIANGNVTTRFTSKNGRYFVETEGADGKPSGFEVRYTVGHRPLQQYLVETEKGRLQVLDLAWDVTAGKWFHLYPDQHAPPGDGLHWTGTYKNWQARCATCHQTGFDKGFDFPTRTYKSHWAELTVGCEACHGPGGAHVAWAKGHGGEDPYAALPMGPGQQAQELAVCGPCHARREAFSQVQPAAGAPFHDNYALALLTPDLYFPDGQQKDEVFILGSFLQSKMKARGVTCSNCHEPHGGGLVAEGNAVCTQCHGTAGNDAFPSLRKADFDTPLHHRHKQGSEAAQCVSCHMPGRSYMRIDPRRDHFFRRPDPLQSKAAGAPDVCTGCHAGKTAGWAAEQIAAWTPAGDKNWQDRSAFIAFTNGDRAEKTVADLTRYVLDREHPAIARATALQALGSAGSLSAADAGQALKDDDPLVRAAATGALRQIDIQSRIALLMPLLADPARSVRQRTAVEIAGAGAAKLPAQDDAAYSRGLRDFVDARMANADTPESHMAIGGLALSRRQWDEAQQAFTTAVEMDPQLASAWLVLAQLADARGNVKAAEDALNAGLAASPRNADMMLARGDLAARQGKFDDALGWYRRAQGADPQRSDVWVAYAIGYALKGDKVAAAEAASRARALDPGVALPQELEQFLAQPK